METIKIIRVMGGSCSRRKATSPRRSRSGCQTPARICLSRSPSTGSCTRATCPAASTAETADPRPV